MEDLTVNKKNDEEFIASRTAVIRNNSRSEIAQEIISHKQDFTERWSIFIFAAIVLILFAVTWFVEYPDIVEARASLTAANAPKEIIPRQDGRLVKLFIHNNDVIRKNQVIGWIESTADHEEVLELSQRLDSSIALLRDGSNDRISYLLDNYFYSLGEIQQQYQVFTVAMQLFNDYQAQGFYSRKKMMLEKDLETLKQAGEIIQIQKRLTTEDVGLARETYEMNKLLSDEKVLSRNEFRKEKSLFVNKQMAIPQLDAALLSNEAEQREKLKEIEQIRHDMAQQHALFEQALQSLKSTVDDWKNKFMLRAPIDGRIFFIIPLQENQFLKQGSLIGYVNPDDSHFYTETYLPQTNFGKIDTGLKVQLRFDAYPYQETGYVEGTVNYISNVASDSGFLATIRLDKGLITSNNIHLSLIHI